MAQYKTVDFEYHTPYNLNDATGVILECFYTPYDTLIYGSAITFEDIRF